MAISKLVNGGNTTVTITYTAVTANIENTLSDAAYNLYTHGFTVGVEGGLFILTNNQIGTIIDAYVKMTIVNLAKEYHIDIAKGAASELAISENETRYI